MNKLCVFNNNKFCNNCNQCNLCDLDNSKVCNNCGKCLELEGIDMKVVNIDEIEEDEDIYNEDYFEDAYREKYENDEHDINYIDDIQIELSENNDPWELIDDIDGLTEVLGDEKKSGTLIKELYPGLIHIEKGNNA
jgi:hypothetical protein